MRKACAVCGKKFEAKRAAARYCGDTCRKRAQRSPGKAASTKAAPAQKAASRKSKAKSAKGAKLAAVVDLPVDGRADPAGENESRSTDEGPLTAATRRELEDAGRLDTALGVAALAIAHRLDGIGLADTGSGVAALIKEHRTALAEAVKDAKKESDPLDKIRESAALKLVSGGGR